VSDTLLYRRGNFNGTFDEVILDALLKRADAEVAFSPGFRWGLTWCRAGHPLEDVYAHTALTYANTWKREMTGREIVGPHGGLPTTCSTPIRTIVRAVTWCGVGASPTRSIRAPPSAAHPRRALRRPRAPARAPLQGHRLGLARRGGRAAGVGRRGDYLRSVKRVRLSPRPRVRSCKESEHGTRTIVAWLMIAAPARRAPRHPQQGLRQEAQDLLSPQRGRQRQGDRRADQHPEPRGHGGLGEHRGLELVVHGPRSRRSCQGPRSRGEGQAREAAWRAGSIDACQITLKRQKSTLRELLEA
jgi:hypothetical protein